MEDHGQDSLVFVSDEGPDMKLAAALLGAAGLRVRFEKDFRKPAVTIATSMQ